MLVKIGADERGAVAGAIVAGALERLRTLEEQVRRVFPHASALTADEVLRWPGVLEEPARNLEELGEAVKDCLGVALRALTESRGREGARIAEMLEKRNAGMRCSSPASSRSSTAASATANGWRAPAALTCRRTGRLEQEIADRSL
jgi:uncharacterized protein YicC (UPF0701 family)